MDAIEMLEKDHQGAKKLMEEVAASSGLKKKTLFLALKHELEGHDHLEEEVFYPSVLAHPKCAGFAAADKQAHESVEADLLQLARSGVEDPAWAPLFEAMRARLLEHIADEESSLFVQIRAALSAVELNALAFKMKAQKELQAQAA